MEHSKAALTQFLLKAWSSKESASRLGKQALFVTAGDRCFRLKADDGMTDVIKAEVAGLTCTQEEPDTSMLLHVAHTADLGAPAVVIKSLDSDVHGCHYSVSQSPDQHSTDLSNRNAAPHPIPRPHWHWTRTCTTSMQHPPRISCL